jgi:hypothetical protein
VQTYEDVAAAHERMALAIPAGTVRHWGQQELTEAFTRVKKQQMGAKWKYAGLTEDDDISPARAATLGLRYFDSLRQRSAAEVTEIHPEKKQRPVAV